MSQQRRVDKVEIWQVVSLILKFPFNGDYMRIVRKLVNTFRQSLASDSDEDIDISKTNAGRIEISDKSFYKMFVESCKRILSIYMNKWMQNALPQINIHIS